MGDTRTSSVVQISGDGESRILQTGGGDYPYRLGRRGSPEGGEIPAGGVGGYPGEGDHHGNSDMKLMASVKVTRDASGGQGQPFPRVTADAPQISGARDNDNDDVYSTIDKSKKTKYRTRIERDPETLQNNQLAHSTSNQGHENLGYHSDQDAITTGNDQKQLPADVQEPEEPKLWQFAELSDNETGTYETVPEHTKHTELPIVNGIAKQHNFGKGFGANGGVANGMVFPDHGKVGFETEPDAEDRKRKEQEKRDRNPLFYIKLVCAYPKTAFGLALGGHLSFLVITALLIGTGYDVMPLVFDRLPLDILDDPDYLRGLAWDNRDQNDDMIKRGSSSAGEDLGTTLFENVVFLFDEEGGNVFTTENLRHIERIENELVNVADYKEKYCLRNSLNKCSKPQSILRFFDGTFSYLDAVFNDTSFSDVTATLNAAQNYDDTKELLTLFIAKNAEITNSSATSWITRIFFPIGWPLAGYSNTEDREEEQQEKLEKFYSDVLMPLGDSYFNDDNPAGNMKVSYGSLEVQQLYIFNQVIMDLALAFGSFCFIAIFMRIQTGSFWITGFAILSIMTSFAGANLIYRVILDFRYIGIFHILSVFIILGIGADDVFIFVDTWKETAHHEYKTLAHRLSDVYRRASLAMFFTSLTTAMAFAVSATSPFLAVYSFGVFSCILVTVNYISVIVFFPTVVITYHLFWEKFKCCCCCPREGVVEAHPTSVTVKKDGAARSHPVVQFFHGPYFRLITHPVWRWVILALYAGLLGVFIYFASQIEVNQEQTKFVSERTNLGYYLSRAGAGSFQGRSARRTRAVYLIWGMRPQDMGVCHKTDALCVGGSVWDDKFDIFSLENQRAMQELCTSLLSLDEATIRSLLIKVNPVTNKPEVDCFTVHLQTFLQEEQDRVINGTRRYPNGTVLSFPLNESMVQVIMEYNPNIYMNNSYSANYTSNMETAVSFWLYNGFQSDSKGWKQNLVFDRFNPLLGESKKTSTAVVNKQVGFDYYYGTRLRYVSITINTTIFGPTLGYRDGIPLRDRWEAFVSGKMAELPEGLNRGYQTTPEGSFFNVWHWLKVQQNLVRTAMQGIIVGLCVALPILMIATMNFISGIYATLTLVCITTMVLGLIPLVGWKVGILESLNLVLVVGLAVDYVVHLAEGYGRSEHLTREERTRDALTEVGISVLSGAVTTVGASLFMLGAKITFFVQFGVFVLTTLGFSLLFALGLFMTVCALIGPQNNTGSIKALFKCCNRNK